MANTYLISMRNSYLLICRNTLKLSNSMPFQPIRLLYSKESLGIDKFLEQQRLTQNQMNNIADKFKDKMKEFVNDDKKNMIFTEDLKNMVHLSNNEDDVLLTVEMIKKFNKQNKQLRFGNFIFGPVIMRLFHINNNPDLALECFLSKDLNGFFDQVASYQILLDLLYENKKYQEILDMFEVIKDRQIDGIKFPKNVINLTLAACYKLNSQDSLKYALKLWKEILDIGHYPMRRAVTFCAGLALNQSQPEVCLEVLSVIRNQNYSLIRNLKAAALTDIGRLEEVISILKSIINNDFATNLILKFNKDVIERVRNTISKVDNPEITSEFNRIEKIFKEQGNISEMTLDEELCKEIPKPADKSFTQPRRYDRYDQNNRFNSNNNNRENNRYSNYRQKPGLNELV